QLRDLATKDALTGALNRRRLFEVAISELERARRYRRPLSVAMVDADHFKRLNDTHGHDVGDRALKVLCDVCRRTQRESDLLGRYGGEEFLVVLPETTLEAAR